MFNSLLNNLIVFPFPPRKSRSSEITHLLQKIILCLLFLHLHIHKLWFDCFNVVTYWKRDFSCYVTVKILWGWFSAEMIWNSRERKLLPLQHSSSLRSPQSLIPSQVLFREMHFLLTHWNSPSEQAVQHDENEVSVEMSVGSQVPTEIVCLRILFYQQFGIATAGILGPSNVNRNLFHCLVAFSSSFQCNHLFSSSNLQ